MLFMLCIVRTTHMMMRTCQPSIKQGIQQGGRKRYKMERPKSWQTKNLPKKADHEGNDNKSNI
jgi:hypothetical protein